MNDLLHTLGRIGIDTLLPFSNTLRIAPDIDPKEDDFGVTFGLATVDLATTLGFFAGAVMLDPEICAKSMLLRAGLGGVTRYMTSSDFRDASAEEIGRISEIIKNIVNF